MESNAKTEILDAIENFIEDNGNAPTKISISIGIGYDLMKLGRNELGSLSEEFFEKGLNALKDRRLFGCTIEVSDSVIDIECS